MRAESLKGQVHESEEECTGQEKKKIFPSFFHVFNLTDLQLFKMVKSDECIVVICSYTIVQRDLDGCITLVTVYNFNQLLLIHCATQIKDKSY